VLSKEIFCSLSLLPGNWAIEIGLCTTIHSGIPKDRSLQSNGGQSRRLRERLSAMFEFVRNAKEFGSKRRFKKVESLSAL
jgi:hypothetical protein